MEEFIIRGLGGAVAPTACTSSTLLQFSGGLGKRYGVVIQAYAAPVYVKLVAKGAADPSPSATDYHYPIPAATAYPIKLASSVDIYVQSAGNVSALEVISVMGFGGGGGGQCGPASPDTSTPRGA